VARNNGWNAMKNHLAARSSATFIGVAVGLNLLLAFEVYPDLVSSLYKRGYSVIPEPQQVKLGPDDFQVTPGWRLERGPDVEPGSPAERALRAGVELRHGFKVAEGGSGPAIRLEIQPGSVPIGKAQDKARDVLVQQAYRLRLAKDGITLSANAPAGLFYGAETLVQLAKPAAGEAKGNCWLPEGEITDWPDLQYREIFWDEQNHLDHLDVLKQAIRRAAYFKVNAFTLRLNEHFEYASAPALVDPYALSPAELQELTDYGRQYFVQVVPYLDGPAHVNFILQRNAFVKLREFPDEAFEMCSTNPDTYRLLAGMFQDLIDSTKGSTYFHLSTDEAWFIGKADNQQCHEAKRAKALGSPSKLWVEYTNKAAQYLKDHGRQVIFWGEDPMQAADIPSLVPWLINGEVYSPAYNRAFRARGIRQIIYTNSLPDDPLFPAYYVLSPQEEVRSGEGASERAVQVFNEISYSMARQQADLMGAGVYAWGDLGPHPETYWLGYAVGASAAWHPGSPDPHQVTQSFYDIFYGQGANGMGRLYQLLSTQAQFFGTSWDREPSGQLPLMFGESYGIGPFVQHLETLPLPSVPSAGYLLLRGNWRQENVRRLELAGKFLAENDELEELLYQNLAAVEFNRYNLEVYLSISRLCRQNLVMLKDLEGISRDLELAQEQAAKLRYADAVEALDRALDAAFSIRDQRNQALHDATATWYQTWFPRAREANGRKAARAPQDFVETEPSERARRAQVGLIYLLDREFSLPFGQWFGDVQQVRNRYAAAHHLPSREEAFDWQDAETLHSRTVDRAL
jgi:hexosaminidase